MREKIQTRGYWRVVIRPANFQQVRVKNVLDLKRILESSAVHFRGWDFPHVDYESDPEIGEDWVSQGIDWEMYVEYWRFYQSGQFLHLDGFKEDWLDGVRQLSVREKWPPRERLAVVNTVYRFTEIFELAIRLSQTEAGDKAMYINIGLNGLKGRHLWVDEAKRTPFFAPHAALINEFKFENEYSQAELAEKTRSLSGEQAIELFRRFGWDPRREIIQGMQEELLSRGSR